MPEVLLFSRPFPFLKRLRDIYEQANGSRVHVLSDIKSYGDFPLVQYQHANIARLRQTSFEELDYADIIARDRYLVFQGQNLARSLVNGVWEFLTTEIDLRRYDLVIGLPIDNYILHLLMLACRKMGVPCIFPDYSPIPGLVRFWEVGSRVVVREVDDKEAIAAMETLRNANFAPVWLSRVRSRQQLIKILAREKVRKYSFDIYRHLTGQPYSFHYNCVYPLGSNYVSRGLSSVFVRNKFEHDVDAALVDRDKYRSVAYLPLQFTPESSLNYAIPSPSFAIYKDTVASSVSAIPDDTLLLVKEHPDFYGYRDASFYNIFLDRPNVRLLDVGIGSAYILNLSDTVVTTGTSSTGIEAVVKGKHLISLGGGYYSDDDVLDTIRDLTDVPTELPRLLQSPRIADEAQVMRFMKTVLSTTMPGYYDYDGKSGFDTVALLKTASSILKIGLSDRLVRVPM